MNNNNNFTETFCSRSYYTQGNTVDIFGENVKEYLAQNFVL